MKALSERDQKSLGIALGVPRQDRKDPEDTWTLFGAGAEETFPEISRASTLQEMEFTDYLSFPCHGPGGYGSSYQP